MDLHELSIQQAHELLSSRKISSKELTRAYLDRIQRIDNFASAKHFGFGEEFSMDFKSDDGFILHG